MYREEYERWKEKSGELTPSACRALQCYADAVRWAGDKETGKKLYEQALDNMHRVFGECAPELRPVLMGLKSLYGPEEKDKGIQVCREGIEVMKKHPYLQETRPDDLMWFGQSLGFYLRMAQRYEEAEEVDREVSELIREKDSKNWNLRATCCESLTRDLYNLKKYSEALEVCLTELRTIEEHLQEKTASVSSLMGWPGYNLRALGRYEEARDHDRKCLEYRTMLLGEDAPLTVQVRKNLAYDESRIGSV